MSKRPGGALSGLVAQSSKEAKRSASARPSGSSGGAASTPRNPFLSRPTQPEDAIKLFLIQARSVGRRQKAANNSSKANIEIEARLGILISPFGSHDMRALSSGPKLVPIQGKDRVAHAFICNIADNTTQQQSNNQQASTNFEGGITRSNYLKWTQAGLSEISPLSAAFSCKKPQPHESESSALKSQMVETESVTSVFAYPNHTRVNFTHHNNTLGKGESEKKEKLSTMDMALPAAPYDLRLTCATETALDHQDVSNVASLTPGWNTKRIKRRRSYVRADKSFAWRMDVTEVTTSDNPGPSGSAKGSAHAQVGYEVEMELSAPMTQKLLSTDDAAGRKLAETLAQQLWFMVQQLNPTHDVLEVDEFLREHADPEATKLAIGQCGTIKRFMDSGCQSWRTAIAPEGGRSQGDECKPPRNFIGSMPVNFSRHNIEEVQRSDGGYFLSEKTDGVRYLLVFTGNSAVLVDRASHQTLQAFQPKPRGNKADSGEDPLHNIISAVKPGCVLDGEVVVHRKLRRPIFIVFDVLANSANEPILHLPFEQRLQHLKAASFVKKGAGVDVFNSSFVSDPNIALPLVRKNFVKRVELDQLLSYVSEERGMRSYRYGNTHNHLTDGIIFQPNAPYICGTDVNLLKWKYLDTVTIDVEILPPRPNFGRNQSNNNENVLNVGVMGEDGTTVDMTRYLRLPESERYRLEADRHENGSKIAEVGFDPTTGEWYYMTMRPDKVAPNHISTVLGTLLELAESLSTEELRYRMSVPSGTRDTYMKDVRNMQKQLLEHQRRKNKAGTR
mmetsp:Transcript_7365/g.16698  ORF Transcript_7365/g.16698 Transcript_7365/m.16698 type:complete len:788 (-) Transcript_7365:247-2610(-)|eukprot:CAMPEP_0172316144 /NCGR_PEP_ID=MMETSP1058-20130122/27444_1 /TAXON_ID=83371 /ORGANISM="Detonula confervacea, Strain CCMP 353" /LENGTH=787 /DNA_ID=CAMNT_0013030399 /DNA_START=70 /DNA_END=2433 /DNA_ORIENTATION=+